MVQTSEPERTRSLPNGHLNLGDEDFAVQALRNFSWSGGLEKKRECFDKIGARFFNGCALACDIEFRAERDEAIVFALNYCRHLPQVGHGWIVRQ